jgi:hypothetical protein
MLSGSSSGGAMNIKIKCNHGFTAADTVPVDDFKIATC